MLEFELSPVEIGAVVTIMNQVSELEFVKKSKIASIMVDNLYEEFFHLTTKSWEAGNLPSTPGIKYRIHLRMLETELLANVLSNKLRQLTEAGKRGEINKEDLNEMCKVIGGVYTAFIVGYTKQKELEQRYAREHKDIGESKPDSSNLHNQTRRDAGLFGVN